MLGLVKKEEVPALKLADEVKEVGEIYTMPRTTSSTSADPIRQPKDPKNLMWLWVTLGAVVLIGGGIAVYLLFFSGPPVADNQPAPIVNNAPVNVEPEPEPTPVVVTTPAERDRQRYLDVKTLQTALELYFNDRGSYPIAITELQLGKAGAATLSAAGFSDYPQAPIYLSQLPADPTSGQDVYYKYLSASGSTYQIFFSLEEGISNLTTGPHYLSETGFDGVEVPDVNPPEREATTSLLPPTASLDTDQDGLTDVEEVIYGTAIDNQDSDGDGYTDGSEVVNGYAPAKAESVKLYETEAFTKYANNILGYSFYYPTTWDKQSLAADDGDIIFTSLTNEFIQVVVQNNPDGLAPEVWYANNVPDLAVVDVPVINIGTIRAARSLDSLNIYFNLGSRLITVSYNLATHSTADYLTTWQAIYKSLSVTAAE